MKTIIKKPLPFRFVLEELASLDPLVKPMFGCHAVYVGEKLVLFLHDLAKAPDQHGLWVATTRAAYASLAAEFSSSRPISPEQLNPSPWLLLPASAPEFEAEALHACELILQGDQRIGRLPKPKKLRPGKQAK